MIDFYGIRYSPWTQKARWALDHHRTPYRYHEFVVLMSDLALRAKLRLWFKPYTVPAIVDGQKKLMDSFDIARYADKYGNQAKLFPDGKLEAVKRFNDLSDEAADASRAILVEALAKNPEVQKEALPRFIPGFLRPLLRFMAIAGAKYVGRAFGSGLRSAAEHRERLRRVLLTLREELAKGKNDTLLGNFSYADVAMAQALSFVEPVSDEFLPLGPATRAAWTDEKLKAEFPDLLAWRDRIYRKYHRPETFGRVTSSAQSARLQSR